MGPPPLALGLVLNEELYRKLATEALMGQHDMVSPQPVGQVPVQGGEVVKKQVLMVIHKLFLESAIELFGVGVHCREAGIGPPVGNAAFVEALLEVAQARRAVGGKDCRCSLIR